MRFEAAVADLTLEEVETALEEAWDKLDTAPQLYLQAESVIEEPEQWLRDMLNEVSPCR